MAGNAEQLGSGRWTPDRLAELRERCSSQARHAERANETARRHLLEAKRRRDLARQRAGARILPMWAARRASYDRFGPVADMWAGDGSPGKATPGPGWPYVSAAAAAAAATNGSEGDGRGEGDAGQVEAVVRDLFEVSLLVTSCRTLTSGPATERLDEAVQRLDRLIREFRLTAFRQMRDRGRTAGGGPDPDDGSQGVVTRLESVSAELFRLADGKSDGSGALHWRDAAQCVSRALQVLHEESLGWAGGAA